MSRKDTDIVARRVGISWRDHRWPAGKRRATAEPAKRFRSVLTMCLTVLFCAASPGQEASPDAADVQIKHVTLGFDGRYKVGRWSPVRVDVVSSRECDVVAVLEAPDAEGNMTELPSVSQHLGTQTSATLRSRFLTGRTDGVIRVRIEDRDGVLLDARTIPMSDQHASESGMPATSPLGLDSRLIVTLGRPAGFASLDNSGLTVGAKPQNREENPGPFLVIDAGDSADLPRDSFGYEAVDSLIIAGDYEIDSSQSTAIRDWVRRGGHLVLALGTGVTSYLAGPLSHWIDDSVSVASETMLLRDVELNDLESYSRQSVRVPVRGRSTVAAKLHPHDGRVRASAFNGPLLVESAYGFGRLTVLALDLNRAPLADWEALPALCERLVSPASRSEAGERTQEQQGRLSHTGVTDIATQLHASLESFPDVQRFSTWSVMGLMTVYLLLIGPLDYYVVHRVFGRPQLTWITFPLLVTAGACAAVTMARSSNGDQLRRNQADLVDIDASGTGLLHARSWMTAFSSETGRYRIESQPAGNSWSNGAADGTLTSVLTWRGIPEDSFGGMYRQGGFALTRNQYEFSTGAATIHNLPFRIWSTQNLFASWSIDSVELAVSNLTNPSPGLLAGSLSHRLPVAIQDWVLAYDTRVYWPRTTQQASPVFRIEPGQVLSPSDPNVTQRRDLRSFLTGTRSKRSKEKQVHLQRIINEQTAYDPLSRDTQYIVRMLTLHMAAGGRQYTGLDNNLLRELDLSLLLQLDRAVLLGQVDMAAGDLRLNNEAVENGRHQTFVRIVLPVKRTGTAPRELPRYESPE